MGEMLSFFSFIMYFLLFLYLRGKETKERYQRKKRKHAIVSYALRAFTNAVKPALSASLVASLDARLYRFPDTSLPSTVWGTKSRVCEAKVIRRSRTFHLVWTPEGRWEPAFFLFLWGTFFFFISQTKKKKVPIK